ncbi:MAG: VOC family protein [Ferrovibrio sp.]|uniref:VOC family protein n=1 Tax=Ferrovibrio sp. TaxID=1917215 RepID=UPI00391CF1CF
MTMLRHVGIVVSDLERALFFYRDLLGFSEARIMDESGDFIDAILGMNKAHLRTVKLASADNASQIELLEFMNPLVRDINRNIDLSTRGPTHIALTVDGLEALHQRMSAAGVEFTTAPRRSVDGRALVTFCRDPDGTYVELVELLEPPQ